MGMLTAMMAVLLRLRRKRKRTTMARRPPMMAVLRTSLTLPSMKSERSATILRTTPSLR